MIHTYKLGVRFPFLLFVCIYNGLYHFVGLLLKFGTKTFVFKQSTFGSFKEVVFKERCGTKGFKFVSINLFKRLYLILICNQVLVSIAVMAFPAVG